MKRVKELNRKEKIQLLKLMRSGTIDPEVITEDTFILEKANELFNLINIAANYKRNEPFTFTALDENTIGELNDAVSAFDRIIEKRKSKN